MTIVRVFCLTLTLLACAVNATGHFLEDARFKGLCAPVFLPDRGLVFDRVAADDLAYLNVDMLRLEFIGGIDDQRRIDYGIYDLVVDEAGKRGVGMLGLVTYQSFPVVYRDKSEWNRPSFRHRYVARLREIVEHYHDREFPIRAWEIWNEPDKSIEGFDVRIEPEPYALLLIDAYEAIKSIDPDALVVMGGISPRGHQYEENYLRDVYRSDAMTAYRAANGHSPFDVVGVHPHKETYQTINPCLGAMLNERIKGVMNEFGDAGMKVWLTELGWNSRDFGLPQQATRLQQSYHYLESLTDPSHPQDGPYIERYFWFQYQNFGAREDWGLRTQDRMTRKASYFAYRDLTPMGREPGGLRPGEEPPAWGGQSDADLPVQVQKDDLLQGMVPEVIQGRLHDASTGSLADLTNGEFQEDPLAVLLADYEMPSIHLRYTFPEPVDIEEVRSFASHPRDWGNRCWQNIDIRVNGRFGVDELRTGRFGQRAPHPTGGVSVVRWMGTGDDTYVARNVSTLDIVYYPVSTNYDFTFLDPWRPRSDATATALDLIRDFDGREAAFAASLIKEIDVIGRVSPRSDHLANR